ncbi:G-protein coupled receptor 20-like [Conger conger]|uniref:G-protein coupled receptor 20-like n=1 Tax=Conger conger TaxID=82655 RepID=UPI002A5AEBAD|nr:G-protein coupled receptor 20-like [Conger conger]
MESSSTDVSALFNLTATPSPTNYSPPVHREPYLHKLAHLDEGLYNDFYSLWIALLVINVLIFIVGMVLNSLALYVFCLRTKPSSTSVIYTINLAVTDLLVNLSLPTRIVLYYSGGKCLTCSYLHIFSYFVNMYCSILFLTSICIDRYLAIVQVEASRRWRSPGVAKGVCVFIWLLAIVVTFSLLTSAIKQEACCLAKIFAMTVFEFFLPLVVITVFTMRIACALARPGLMEQSREQRKRAVQLLVTVLLIFTVCFTPFHVRQVVVFFYPDVPHHVIIYHVTVTLSSLNSCLDPVVYCFVTTNFRATVRGMFRRAEVEQTSGDVVSMQRSSKGSGTATAIAHSMIMLNLTSPLSGAMHA